MKQILGPSLLQKRQENPYREYFQNEYARELAKGKFFFFFLATLSGAMFKKCE
jgi:hypothetical protein